MREDENDDRQPAMVSIVGKSRSGKTTLLEKLIPELKRRGIRVGTVKHHAHANFEVDKPGKDTWRQAEAGAESVAMISPGKMFLVRQTPNEMSLEHVASMLGDVDLILTEGFRWAPIPKIEVVRADRSTQPICMPHELLAIVSDLPLNIGVPLLGLEAIREVADLLESRLPVSGLKRKHNAAEG